MNQEKSMSARAIVPLLVFSSILSAAAGDWPQWRGPNGDGISGETRVPVEWSKSKNVEWRTPLPGEGHSSPTVVGSNIFITAAEPTSGDRLLLRLDATTGKIVWKRVVLTAGIESMHRENSAASSTPITDGKHIFTSFQNGKRVDIQCYDFDGNRVWSVQPLRFSGLHGYSYTPVLHGDLLIFDFAQNDEAAVLALDKRNGQTRWRWDRPTREISHITPLLISRGESMQVVVCGSDQIRAFKPETGDSIWWCDGPTEVCVAGLVFDGTAVVANGGYPRRTRLAVDVTGRGDVSDSHVRWKSNRAVSYVPSPVHHEGYVYTVIDDGMLNCADAKTGDLVWEERIGGRFRSSLVLANDNIYATSDKGVTTVFKANPKRFEKVAVNDLGEFCYATPALANGRIYMRTGEALYCIGTGAGK